MPKPSVEWRDRIIGHGTERTADLLANPNNYKVHPDEQRAAFEEIVAEVGLVAPIIVNRRSGFIVDGHMRVHAAAEVGQETLPVSYVDLTQDEELQVLLTFDPIGAMAEGRPLAELLDQVETTGPLMDTMMNSWRGENSAVDRLLQETQARAERPSREPEPDEDLQGWGKESLRAIIVFADETELAACFARLGWSPAPGYVIFRWREQETAGE